MRGLIKLTPECGFCVIQLFVITRTRIFRSHTYFWSGSFPVLPYYRRRTRVSLSLKNHEIEKEEKTRNFHLSTITDTEPVLIYLWRKPFKTHIFHHNLCSE